MKVLKFGGTSVGSPENLRNVMRIIQMQSPRAVVVSAFGGFTDQLIQMGQLAKTHDESYKEVLASAEKRHMDAVRELLPVDAQSALIAELKVRFNELDELLRGVFLIRELSLKSLDLLMSFGEHLSAKVVAAMLSENGVPAQFLDARKVVKTDNYHGAARVDFDQTYANIAAHFQANPGLHIVTGFIGSNAEGDTTTLGRGGSDYSAALFGAGLNAEEVQIWTDVSGVLTADPRRVPNAFPVDSLSYEEAMEMSHFGAKVIHPPTMRPAMQKGIPIFIKNTMEPEAVGSKICADPAPCPYAIKGISSIDKVALFRLDGSGMQGVPGISKRLFGALARADVSVILISQASSEHSICFAVAQSQSSAAEAAVNEEFEFERQRGSINNVHFEDNLCVLAVVGESMKSQRGLAGRVFQALGDGGINVVAIAQGSSELNISMVLESKDETAALNAIHDAFFGNARSERTHVFLVGCGLVGGAFLDQVHAANRKDVRVVAVANSRQALMNAEGVNLENWRSEMNAAPAESLEGLVEKMKAWRLPNSVLVDCTASAAVSKAYAEVLEAGFGVVAANKKANSGSMQDYQNLRALSGGRRFLYETNVGAGLPVLDTLQNLARTGDEVVKIEAVLSGTLSYLFNTYCAEDLLFSDLVVQAKAKGYTEPDPRDDLSGMDVARKILILARECGHHLELDDVDIHPLLPAALMEAESVEEFMNRLPEVNEHFAAQKAAATAEGKVLRMIAKLENGKANLALESVGPEHPFFNLSGSDNIIAFNTKRYNAQPLVVKGPGAGADVTAAGVFADVLRFFHNNSSLPHFDFAERAHQKLEQNKLNQKACLK